MIVKDALGMLAVTVAFLRLQSPQRAELRGEQCSGTQQEAGSQAERRNRSQVAAVHQYSRKVLRNALSGTVGQDSDRCEHALLCAHGFDSPVLRPDAIAHLVEHLDRRTGRRPRSESPSSARVSCTQRRRSASGVSRSNFSACTGNRFSLLRLDERGADLIAELVARLRVGIRTGEHRDGLTVAFGHLHEKRVGRSFARSSCCPSAPSTASSCCARSRSRILFQLHQLVLRRQGALVLPPVAKIRRKSRRHRTSSSSESDRPRESEDSPDEESDTVTTDKLDRNLRSRGLRQRSASDEESGAWQGGWCRSLRSSARPARH